MLRSIQLLLQYDSDDAVLLKQERVKEDGEGEEYKEERSGEDEDERRNKRTNFSRGRKSNQLQKLSCFCSVSCY